MKTWQIILPIVLNNYGIHSSNHSTQSQCIFRIILALYSPLLLLVLFERLFNYKIQSDLTKTGLFFLFELFLKLLTGTHATIKNNTENLCMLYIVQKKKHLEKS